MENTITKTFQIVGVTESDYETVRHFADALMDQHDLFEDVQKQSTCYMFIGDDEPKEISRLLHSRMKDADLGHYLDKEHYTETDYKYTESKFVRNDLKSLLADVFLPLDSTQKGIVGGIESSETGETLISPSVTIKRMRMPKPLDEQKVDDVFDDSQGSKMGVALRLSLRDCPPELAQIVDSVMPKLLGEMLLEYDPIDRVRLINCFKEQRETYTCPSP